MFYCNPQQSTVPNVTTSAQQAYTSPLSVHAPAFTPTGTKVTPQVTPAAVTVQDLAQLITATKRDHLPEWKLAQYNGDPLQWHEWFGQFKSAIDSTTLSDDVKLTYLKTLVTGKAKTAIAEFAYCGTMYRDALQTLERKFGQPHAVVTAYLDKLSSVPPLKMHNSESIISYSATISGIVGVFRSLKYDHDLSSASLLAQAVQKLPPNMKEAWSLHVVKRNLARPTLLDFNDWLKEKAEAHERMKASSNKPKTEERVALLQPIKPKLPQKYSLPPLVLEQLHPNLQQMSQKLHLALFAKKNTLYGVVRSSGKRHPHREQRLLPTTNCVSLASTVNTPSATVRNQESA